VSVKPGEQLHTNEERASLPGSRMTSPARTALFVVTALLASLAPNAHAADDGCNVTLKKANLNFTVKDINGKDVRLSQYKGKVVLVNFWATWCTPCRVEIPSLTALYRDYKDQGFVVLGVSVDSEVSAVKPFARVMKMNYPVLIGAGHEDLSDAFGPFLGFPTSVLVKRDGAVCVRQVGTVSRSKLEEQINKLL
jgi:thiol-disulfide isomerase/thioredoxin